MFLKSVLGVHTAELKFGLKQTNPEKTASVSDRRFGYSGNISLVQESKLNALEK